MIRRPRSKAGKAAREAGARRRVRLVVACGSVAVLVATVPAAGLGARAPSVSNPGEIVSKVADQTPAEIRDYWTRKRMRHAEPVDLRLPAPSRAARADAGPADPSGNPELVLPAGPGVPDTRAGILDGLLGGGGPQPRSAVDVSANSTSFPQRVHGKVYFTISDGGAPGDFVCSGTVVRSRSHTLVWTAGHCVHDLYQYSGGYASNFEFVPGFNNGSRPFGTWTARELFTTSGFINGIDQFDIGAAVMTRVGNGRGIQDVVGSRGIAFNQPRSQVYSAFGYPAQSPFNGQRLYRCDSAYLGGDQNLGSPEPMRISCNMTGGSSGGGWVVDDKFVASVTTHGYEPDFDCSSGLFNACLYGPYFGNVAKNLYQDARGKKLECAGAEVTNLGTGASDDYEGTAGADAFKLRKGGDTADGANGKDRLCGGKGKDKLIGGPGHDVCNGGKGHDTARGCEEKRKIP